MKLRNLLILFVQIFLEVYIFPKMNFREEHKVLSRTTVHFLGIIHSVYTTRVVLRHCSKFLPIVIISINYLFGKFLIANFYDSSCKYFDSMHSLIIILVTTIPFIFMTKESDIEEFEKEGLIKSIYNGLATIVSVNGLFYFYKHYHLKHGNIVEYYFNMELGQHFVMDFIFNSFPYSANNLLCFYFTPKHKRNWGNLWNIFRKFILLILANFAFYSIYSFQMARGVFETLYINVPYPNNLILYNILPKELDQRFRLFLYIFYWILL